MNLATKKQMINNLNKLIKKATENENFVQLYRLRRIKEIVINNK